MAIVAPDARINGQVANVAAQNASYLARPRCSSKHAIFFYSLICSNWNSR
jgi:hypothetical protein